MTNRAGSDQKQTDLDLHCLQMQGISGFSRNRVNNNSLVFHEAVSTGMPFHKAISTGRLL